MNTSKMKLKCTHPNGEVVLEKKLNHMDLILLKKYINCIKKWILQVILSRRCSNCQKNKIVHNFHITNPTGMNQRYPRRKKYNLFRKKSLNKNENFEIFYWCLLSLVLSLFGHNFISWAHNEKNLYSWEAHQFFYIN
jgi:hypothetical protein